MPFLSSIQDDDKVPHVLAKFNTGTGRPLLEFHEALLRGDSPTAVRVKFERRLQLIVWKMVAAIVSKNDLKLKQRNRSPKSDFS